MLWLRWDNSLFNICVDFAASSLISSTVRVYKRNQCRSGPQEQDPNYVPQGWANRGFSDQNHKSPGAHSRNLLEIFWLALRNGKVINIKRASQREKSASQASSLVWRPSWASATAAAGGPRTVMLHHLSRFPPRWPGPSWPGTSIRVRGVSEDAGLCPLMGIYEDWHFLVRGGQWETVCYRFGVSGWLVKSRLWLLVCKCQRLCNTQ